MFDFTPVVGEICLMKYCDGDFERFIEVKPTYVSDQMINYICYNNKGLDHHDMEVGTYRALTEFKAI